MINIFPSHIVMNLPPLSLVMLLQELILKNVEIKIERIAVKFVNYENEFVASQPNKVSALTIIWGAKESMYKCFGQKGLGFYEHCKVEPFDTLQETTVSRIDYGADPTVI